MLIFFDMETNVTINISRSNLAGNLLPWDGSDWEMSSEIGENEYQVDFEIGFDFIIWQW